MSQENLPNSDQPEDGAEGSDAIVIGVVDLRGLESGWYTRMRRRELGKRALWGLGGLVVGSAAATLGFLRYNANNSPMPVYPFTTDDLNSMNRQGHDIQIDPKNRNNQLYLGYGEVTNPAGKIVYNAPYVSIDGGTSWTSVDRPAANGLNRNPDTYVLGASFGGYSVNAAAHEPGQMLQVTYRNNDTAQTSIELAVAGAYGVEQVDLSTADMTEAPTTGTWSVDRGVYRYQLNGTNAQGQETTIYVTEPFGK